MTWEAFLAFKMLETSTRDAFKRAPGDLLATNFAPRVSQEGSGERFRSDREASWGQETPKSSPGGLLAANLAPKSLFQMAESSPIVLGMLKEASKTPQEALLEHWDLQTSKLVS